ncbi:MAG: hypothetical protein ABIS28_00245 [Caldimonas sp.]
MKLSAARVGVLIWVLIYGGLFVLALGLALREVHGLLAGSVSIGGLVALAIGIVLIWYRSRLLRVVAPPAVDASAHQP